MRPVIPALGLLALSLAGCSATNTPLTTFPRNAGDAMSVASQVADKASCAHLEELGPMPGATGTWGFSCMIGETPFQIDTFADAAAADARVRSLGAQSSVFKQNYLIIVDGTPAPGGSDTLAPFN
jgi:hypothetical protein